MTNKKKYDWTQFKLRIEIRVPPSKVYRAWTDDKLVSKWFTEKTIIEPEKNGRVYYEWLGGDKFDTRIINIRKNRLFLIPFGSKGEKIKVSFKKSKHGTICEIHQFDMKTTPHDKWAMHKGCETGWTFFLTNLKAFLEHGIDLRSHDKKKSYKQNFVNS